MREGNSLPICRVEEGSQSITNSHVSPLKSLNQGKKQVCAISLHPKVVQSRLVFVDAGLRYVLIMIGTRTEASKITTQAHELSGSLTSCEDAQSKRRHPDRSRTKKPSVFLKRR